MLAPRMGSTEKLLTKHLKSVNLKDEIDGAASDKDTCSQLEMSSTLSRVRVFLKRRGKGGIKSIPITLEETLRQSVLRKSSLLSKLSQYTPCLYVSLILAGYVYTLVLPWGRLGRSHYVSENALQPAQVNTYWNWADVHIADQFADDVARWANLVSYPGKSQALAIRSAFEILGLPAAVQSYSFDLKTSGSPFYNNSQTVSGTNTYAILRAPKTDGAESLILSASWLSRSFISLEDLGENQGNLDIHAKESMNPQKPIRRQNARGVAIILALANYFKKYSMWSKDIIFLISDGYTDGVQAFLDSYHGYGQNNLISDPIEITSGPVWAALNIDYPYHSFSHVGIFFEGVNGQLPNLDFINSASHILRNVGIPAALHYDTCSAEIAPSFLKRLPYPFCLLDTATVRKHLRSARTLWMQLGIEALGIAQGPESMYGRYRIDCITLFGAPSSGPHGFYSLGKAVESTFRSLNNLLERFHQSFFLYIMTSVDSFIAIGNYLAAPVLISAGLTVFGLSTWEGATRSKLGERRGKPIGFGLAVIGATYAASLVLWVARVTFLKRANVTYVFIWESTYSLLFPHLVTITLHSYYTATRSLCRPAPGRIFVDKHAERYVLKSYSLILTGLALAIISTLNVGAAIFLSLSMALPYLLATWSPSFRNHRSNGERALHTVIFWIQIGISWLSNPFTLLLFHRIHDQAVNDLFWEQLLLGGAVGGSWSMGLIYVVWIPILMQGSCFVLLQ